MCSTGSQSARMYGLPDMKRLRPRIPLLLSTHRLSFSYKYNLAKYLRKFLTPFISHYNIEIVPCVRTDWSCFIRV